VSGSTTDGVIVGWIALCLVMFAHRRLRQEGIADRAPGTWLGIFVQAMAFSVIWTMRRDPSMLGMLLATGLSSSRMVGLAGGVALFIAGTLVRVHYEERLRRQRFGAEFDRYARTVPSSLPFARPRPAAGGDRNGGA
jgi:protein-S-isoprenylcysteine O-methyltransferase Ste14